ncbi:MAG: ATP-binding cassette domain-containing protein [Synergistaceae bacterium]|jgi:putative ABC transport system ATP-binding protein|nr:ATP-binding cassette domain-containing protein [Synergistaceae bacterium]
MTTPVSTAPLLEVRELRMEYPQPGKPVPALRLDFLEARAGEAIAVTGPSGSGKTTLLHLLAALIRPTGGVIRFGGRDLGSMGTASARWRALSVGYVFQNMNLLPDFSLLENLTIAAEISGVPRGRALDRSRALLRRLGLEGLAHRRPAKLSLGEQQRGAVARAVLHAPPLILADEPTASLDAVNAGLVMDLLLELSAESQSLLLVATHDETVRKRFSRVVELQKAAGVENEGE